MILNRKDNMTAFYGNGNLRVAYDIFGNQFEREMQRERYTFQESIRFEEEFN